jgi:aminopeptidase N
VVPEVGGNQASQRSSLVAVESYEISLDLVSDPASFRSRTVIRFGCRRPGAATFVDVAMDEVNGVWLNGRAVAPADVCNGSRMALPALAARNVLAVEASSGYASHRHGLSRIVDAPNGVACVHSYCFPDHAPQIFACFDQPDLRARFLVEITAPDGWSCLSNAAIVSSPPVGRTAGRWRFAATRPIAPCVLSVVAGTLSSCTLGAGLDHSRLPLGLHAAQPDGAGRLAVVAEGFVRCLSYYENALAARYPYPKCDLAFVPGFRSLGFGAPGLITFSEEAFDQYARRDDGRLIVLSHELAHAWIGGWVDMRRRDDGWLIEALTTYLSRTATEELLPAARPWSTRTDLPPPDHGYDGDARLIKTVEHVIGRDTLFDGLRDFLRRFGGGTAAPQDLTDCWSRASGRALPDWLTAPITGHP